MTSRREIDKATVGIVGLGYVGMPLAQAFARNLRVIGYDIDKNKVKKLKQQNDLKNLLITDEPTELSKADFIIIAVPTPVTRSKEPDLSPVESAAHIAGKEDEEGKRGYS